MNMETTPPRIGVVLSSGGGRGIYAHTGFLLALEELGLPIAAGAGCSAGAVVGGIHASGAGLEAWSRTLAALDPKAFWRPDPLPRLVWRLAVRRGRGFTGLSGTDAALDLVRRHLAARTFEGCRYPFYCVAVNLNRNRQEVFSAGDLAPRLMASAAMPLLYRPVEIDGEYFCDGAIITLAPAEAICCRHGLDALIIHHVSQRASARPEMAQVMARPWSAVELLHRLLYRQRPWYLSDAPLAFRACPCGCAVTVVVVEPQVPDLRWPLATGGPEIQDAAREQALALLAPHRRTLLDEPARLRPTTP